MLEVIFNTGHGLGSGMLISQPLLGQIVNVGFGPAGILGIGLAGAGAALYFLRSLRPELARDHDIFFAAVGLLCGGILFFQGWRLDPILLFGQLLLTGSSVFFAVESIRLRSVATTQAKRNAPIVDDERPVSRVWRAELDELMPEDEIPSPRLRGTPSRSRRSGYVDALEEETPRRRRSSGRPPSSRSLDDRPTGERPPRRRGPRPPVDEQDITGTEPNYERRSRSSSSDPRSTTGRKTNNSSNRPPRRRPRPNPENPAQSEPYVDYQPLDYKGYSDSESESDNSGNFDDE